MHAFEREIREAAGSLDIDGRGVSRQAEARKKKCSDEDAHQKSC
jgi:hypothetical protein